MEGCLRMGWNLLMIPFYALVGAMNIDSAICYFKQKHYFISGICIMLVIVCACFMAKYIFML